MRRLVIGIPARNEAETIVDLADALEAAALLLGEVSRVELVLAYQDSEDDTLDLIARRSSRPPWQILRCRPGQVGKGRNVKLLLDHTAAGDADLLLVDGDMRECSPLDIARFVSSVRDQPCELLLPLWCRPWGHANTTNLLAVPIVRALFGARVRQPLAGQRFIDRRAVRSLAGRLLPDNYGIDIAMTMAVLDGGGHVGQVVVPKIEHDGRQTNSEQIMVEVAVAALTRATRPGRDRSDVVEPIGYVTKLAWPDEPAATVSTRPGGVVDHGPWVDALVTAVCDVRRGADPAAVAPSLGPSFSALAEARRAQRRPPLEVAEDDIWSLAERVAGAL